MILYCLYPNAAINKVTQATDVGKSNAMLASPENIWNIK